MTGIASIASIASFAPLAAARTGVADYAAGLVHALRKFAPVTLNTTVNADRVGQDDVALYHLGNNQLHREIYQLSLAHPGVVVLHDAVLTHFFLGLLDEKAWIEEFVYNYGEWSLGFAGELWQDRARSAADSRYFEYPMLKRIAETSLAIVVHNPAAARAVLRHAPHAKVVEIPHYFDGPKPNTGNVASARLRVGVFGFLRETKRLPAILRSLEKSGIDFELVIAGAFASADLERSLAPWLARPNITFHGHLSDDAFWRIAQSVDVCVNLRYPTAHETSGIGVRLMGIGKPVIFTAGEELGRIPQEACLRIEHGPLEEQTLAAYFVWLAGNPQAIQEIGRRAATHIASEHALDSVAARYWEALTNARVNARDLLSSQGENA